MIYPPTSSSADALRDSGYTKSALSASFLRWAFLVYLIFVVYGSLVPFRFEPMELGQAWDRFLNARYLNIGLLARADWIANIVLYIPLAFLGVAWAHRKLPEHRISLLRVAGVLLLCAVVAFGVEFVQVFFRPRTVSVNDLIAELLGSCMGLALWYAGRSRLGRALGALAGDRPRALSAALSFYLVIYLALSLFPYDFLVSSQEISWKMSSDRYHWFVAANSCAEPLRCVSKLVAEALIMVPLGVLLALRTTRKVSPLSHAIFVGVLLGVFVELLQFFMASGVSQGISVVMRGLGAALGAGLYGWLQQGGLARFYPVAKRMLAVFAVPYLALIMALNGWFSASWTSLDEALLQLEGQMFIPFYFHYFTSEANAMDSLLATVGMYAPVGLGYWLWTRARAVAVSAAAPALLAGLVAFIMETGKLFVVGKHPDPTSILIAVFASGTVYRLALWLSARGFGLPSSAPPRHNVAATTAEIAAAMPEARAVPAGAESQPTAAARPSLSTGTAAVSLLALTAWGLTHYPVGAGWLALVLGVYAVVLWHRPSLWLLVVPALLPLLDFTTWTGWFFFDEFDFLLMVTLAVLVARTHWNVDGLRLPRHTAWLLALFAVAYAISTLRGAVPLQTLDDNALASYLSSYNAFRVAKGIAWAFILLPFLRREMTDPRALQTYFLPGALAGFGATAVLVVYERWLFPGVFNFSTDYRATAFFSSMHTGGASVDAYLAFSLPLVASCFLVWRGRTARLAGLFLYTIGLYALFVTFSRIDYLAFAVATAIVLLGLARTLTSSRQFFSVALPLAVITAVIGVSLLLGPYIHVRFTNVAQDATARWDEWRGKLALRPADLATRVFGVGVGSFPRVYFWAEPGSSRPASFAYVNDGNNRFLRLGSGNPLYILQRIRPTQSRIYQLRASVRAAAAEAALSVIVCEKSLLYSARCVSKSFRATDSRGAWQRHEAVFRLDNFGASGRPVFLALYNARDGTVVDVDRVSFSAPDGLELIANGDFSHGSDRWFFVSDDHASWHTNSLWVHVLFEQGWLGLLLLGLMIGGTLWSLAKTAWRGDSMSWVLASSLAAGLTVATADSILSAPRIALLLFLLLFVSLLHTSGTPAGAESRSSDRRRPRHRRHRPLQTASVHY